MAILLRSLLGMVTCIPASELVTGLVCTMFTVKEGLVFSKYDKCRTITLKSGSNTWCGCVGYVHCEIKHETINYNFVFTGKLVE